MVLSGGELIETNKDDLPKFGQDFIRDLVRILTDLFRYILILLHVGFCCTQDFLYIIEISSAFKPMIY